MYKLIRINIISVIFFNSFTINYYANTISIIRSSYNTTELLNKFLIHDYLVMLLKGFLA